MVGNGSSSCAPQHQAVARCFEQLGAWLLTSAPRSPGGGRSGGAAAAGDGDQVQLEPRLGASRSLYRTCWQQLLYSGYAMQGVQLAGGCLGGRRVACCLQASLPLGAPGCREARFVRPAAACLGHLGQRVPTRAQGRALSSPADPPPSPRVPCRRGRTAQRHASHAITADRAAAAAIHGHRWSHQHGGTAGAAVAAHWQDSAGGSREAAVQPHIPGGLHCNQTTGMLPASP